MKKILTDLKDCYIIEPDRFGDERGFYSPFFAEKNFIDENIGMKGVVQASRSMSSKGTVRGLHFQNAPLTQAKLVECLSGEILDVVVDLREDSKTYLKWTSVHLTPENGRQLFVPRGFAHGFVSLKDNSLFQYIVDNDYSPIHEDGIYWNDPKINIDWQFEKYGIDNIILSEKDKARKKMVDRSDLKIFDHYRYLVTGCKGQLGYDVVRELNKRGIYDVLALDIDDMDITNSRIVNKIFEEYSPEYVIHCAAYTNVDKAEENYDLCKRINVDGTKNITEASRRINAKLLYISTDYVFDGAKDGLYEVTDIPNPLNVYGKTKLMGEQEVSEYGKSFIVRTSWVFGINGKNFIKTMLNLANTKEEVNVISDQVGSPTYTKDLAKLIIDLIQTEKYGIYHANNEGYCSWDIFAQYVFDSNKKNIKVNKILTKDYNSKATRPLNSRLSKKSLIENGFGLLPDWMNAVDRYNEELNEEKKVLKKVIK
ncbi:MAG: dTDP-4-dehydrorhamnose reductase [bacterium]|nr:dTDP-4-dehydrorhamnose reductase [bacterium]